MRKRISKGSLRLYPVLLHPSTLFSCQHKQECQKSSLFIKQPFRPFFICHDSFQIYIFDNGRFQRYGLARCRCFNIKDVKNGKVIDERRNSRTAPVPSLAELGYTCAHFFAAFFFRRTMQHHKVAECFQLGIAVRIPIGIIITEIIDKFQRNCHNKFSSCTFKFLRHNIHRFYSSIFQIILIFICVISLHENETESFSYFSVFFFMSFASILFYLCCKSVWLSFGGYTFEAIITTSIHSDTTIYCP